MSGGITAAALADRLEAVVVDQLERLAVGPLAGWEVPRTYGGHVVAPDVRADLVYTLGLLGAAGVTEVAGRPVEDLVTHLLADVDGAGTDTFFSYRIAETLLRHGPFADNPLLAGLSSAAVAEVRTACDSTGWVELLDAGALPRNYAAVLARCEVARERLGLAVDPAVADSLVARAEALVAAPFHDDSEDGAGGRYDIYTADLALFCAPLADRLAGWRRFTADALTLVEQVAAPGGAAITWGRSTGVLAICLTVELGALVAADAEGFGRDRDRWVALAALGVDRFDRAPDRWFDDEGVITAHRHRSPYRYRGPHRRLQMTLDVAGKLAWSAGRLRAAAELLGDPLADPLVDPLPDTAALVRFDDRAAVWTHRSHDRAVVVPFVGPTRSDYQSAPRNPGLFEVPVDRSTPTWVPAVHAGGRVWCGGGVPTRIEAAPGRVTAEWDGFPVAGGTGGGDGGLGGQRIATVTVDGRTLRLEESLRIEAPPGPTAVVAVSIPEAEGRPLRVVWTAPEGHRTRRVVTDGISEWRSFWGELPVVHELDVVVPPDGRVELGVEVRPLWRVSSEALHHHYHQSLYAPMAGEVRQVRFAKHHIAAPDAVDRLRHVDLHHLHWPEWHTGAELDTMRAFLDLLERAGVRLVWTMHNLRPHWDDDAFEALYSLVASRAHGVIHHSAWGRDRALGRYRFADGAVHAVIPHGHWGNLRDPGLASPSGQAAERAAAEAELGLAPLPEGGLRIAVVGAPRRDKRTLDLIDAFVAADRDDLQLLVLSLADGETPPPHPRVVARPYEFVDRATYNRRLAAADVLAFPFDPAGDMLTTGVVADVIGWGIPALVSSWAYLAESLGPVGIPMGDTVDEMAAALGALTPAAVATAAGAIDDLAAATSWPAVAAQTLALFDAVGTTHR